MSDQQLMFQEFQEMSERPADQVTVQQLDSLIVELQKARHLYDEKKKLASEANAKCEELENVIMGTLEKLGKSSYEAAGIGRVTKCTRVVFKIPRTNEDKVTLFEYIERTYGQDTLTAMVSINHNTLTSWANKEIEETGVGKIPGLEAPTSVEFLQLRSQK